MRIMLSIGVVRLLELFGSFREPEFTTIPHPIWWAIFCFFADQLLSTLLLCVRDPASEFGVGFRHVECDLRGQLVHEMGCVCLGVEDRQCILS